ncbi:purine-nucleoside phosphorylase [Endozoicomonas sp.]|nr:purine-nucleoside phosphorylase [Endozoicomonas sp.]
MYFMLNLYDKVIESAEAIRKQAPSQPKVAVILGSGLGELTNKMEDQVCLPYIDIPNFPVSTVKGHGGQLVFGKMGAVDVMAMQGRFHFYEGYSMQEVTYPVYVMKQLGIEKLIVTNAAGGIDRRFDLGSLMLITDFLDMMGTNPLIGSNDERFGVRFPDMSEPYSNKLMNQAKTIAGKLGIAYKEGVYAGLTGPYYETAAQIRMLDKVGASAAGMSTVPETIVANYLGMEVLGISCITNMATGISETKHSHDSVVEGANKASADFCRWVAALVPQM